MTSMLDLVTQFGDLVKYEIHRDGIEDLMKWLSRTDFYSAPASTRFHGNYEGGLLEHSLNVYYRLEDLCNHWFPNEYSAETIAIVALFHDLCKIGLYKQSTRNVKNEETGTWTKEPFYRVDEDFCFGGHGSKSMYLVQNFIKLAPEEASAINCHMGSWDISPTNYLVGSAFEQNKLAWALHVADEAATYLDERKC